MDSYDATLIADVEQQEKELLFTTFSNDDAWDLGQILVQLAKDRGLGIAIDIARGDQQIFHFALPGSSAHNDKWIDRKKRTVREFAASSYLVGLRFPILDQYVLEEAPWMDARLYSGAGGCFPIAVRGAGIVGTVAVSGLPPIQDHALVVEAIRTHLGLN